MYQQTLGHCQSVRSTWKYICTHTSYIRSRKSNKINVPDKHVHVWHHTCSCLQCCLHSMQIYVFEYSLESNCGGSAIRSSFVRVGRNTTSDTLSLHNYCYRVNVFAINHKAWGPGSDSLYFKYSTQDSPMFALLSGGLQYTLASPVQSYIVYSRRTCLRRQLSSC